MGSLCSTIYDDVSDPSEGQFMYQPRNGKKITYYSKRQEQNRINEREERFRKKRTSKKKYKFIKILLI